MRVSLRAAGAISLLFGSLAVAADESLDEVVVTADLRDRNLGSLPASATVLDAILTPILFLRFGEKPLARLLESARAQQPDGSARPTHAY